MDNRRRVTKLWSHAQWRCELIDERTLRLYEGGHRVVELAVDDEPMARACADLWLAATRASDDMPPLSDALRPARLRQA